MHLWYDELMLIVICKVQSSLTLNKSRLNLNDCSALSFTFLETTTAITLCVCYHVREIYKSSDANI
jgi:hypothetical protein